MLAILNKFADLVVEAFNCEVNHKLVIVCESFVGSVEYVELKTLDCVEDGSY